MADQETSDRPEAAEPFGQMRSTILSIGGAKDGVWTSLDFGPHTALGTEITFVQGVWAYFSTPLYRTDDPNIQPRPDGVEHVGRRRISSRDQVISTNN